MSAFPQKQTFDVPETDYFSLTVALWARGRPRSRYLLFERLYLLVDELIRADRCAGTMPLAKLF